MQLTSVLHDLDTGLLALRLSTGEEFLISNPAIAQSLKDKISVGGRITDVQRTWLEQYRLIKTEANKERMRAVLNRLRADIRGNFK